MLQKTRQQVERAQLTAANHVPARRSRQFILNHLRRTRLFRTSPPLKATVGLLRGVLARGYSSKNRVKHRAFCALSGRGRGIHRRYSVARTKIKELSNIGLLLGTQKSSW